MCSHYVGAAARARLARIGAWVPDDWEPPPGGLHLYPVQVGAMIRRPRELDSGDEAVPAMEAVQGHFGLLPSFATDVHFGKRTYNCRSETAATLASFKAAWAKPRHCIIPSEVIYEPDWRSGKAVPTRVTRADGEPIYVAGLWSPWKDPVTGQWVNSYTMLTLNADRHPIFKELHRPDPKRPPNMQDKRMVAMLRDDELNAWLDASPADSMDLIRQYPAELLRTEAEPLPPRPKKVKPEPPTSDDLF